PTAGQAGFGAGDGGSAGGGGGAAMGGAVFVAKGGTLTINGSGNATGNSVTGGSGANTGSAFGSGFFVQGSALAFGAGNFTLSDVIADQSGSGGSSIADGFGGTGGQSSITKSGAGVLTLSAANSYGGGTTINEGSTLVVGDAHALGTGTLTLNGGATGVTVTFNGSFTIANNIVAAGDPIYNILAGSTVNLTGVLSGSGDVVVNEASGYAGTLILSGANTYTGPTVVDAGILQAGSTSAFGNNSAVTVASGAVLDLAGFSNAIGSLAGAGIVTNSGAAATLTTGGDTTSTVFSGTIQDGAGSIALTKTGIGLLLLSGSNSYTGATIVSGGTLQVDGSIASSSQVTVQSGAALSGSGTVGATVIDGGAIFAPGNGTAGTSMVVSGSLALASGAVYLVQVSPSAASFASVAGVATLGGATVDAVFASGSYISKRYTILTASGGVSGTFGSLVTTGLPSNIRSVALSYDANDVYLDLALNYSIPSGLNGNQQRVGNALTSFFNANGGIAAVYAGFTPAGLTQAAGESGTGSQQTTFAAMTQFMGLLTDPFTQRDNGPGSASGTTGFADEEQASAYTGHKRIDAFAMLAKTPPQALEPHWSVWASAFGGSQSTAGDATTGSNDTTSRVFGTAVGADYWVSAHTSVGFALAGGGTNFSVANGGSGRSDLFQAGAYLRHTDGAAYISAALAYGWQDITTDRTVTIAGADHLRAEFNANAYSGRLEGGYRYIAPWIGGIGLTPYGAAQFTTFDLPAYAEQVISGAAAFALNYSAKSVTDTRGELGLRSDKSFAMQNGVLTLRGRFGWAHDFNPDRSIAATFQALPGASFVVNGAAQARDAALTTAAVEMKWLNGWSAAASFEGEFSNAMRSYAGKGGVRYAW
ncbi:autotransporter outer membrane beta-barrel domain-containing protein, partial [Bradyrhizobium sp. UFLA05-112]